MDLYDDLRREIKIQDGCWVGLRKDSSSPKNPPKLPKKKEMSPQNDSTFDLNSPENLPKFQVEEIDLNEDLRREIRTQKEGWIKLQNDPTFDPNSPENLPKLQKALAGYKEIKALQEKEDKSYKKFRKEGDKIRARVAAGEKRMEDLGYGPNYYTGSAICRAILEM